MIANRSITGRRRRAISWRIVGFVALLTAVVWCQRWFTPATWSPVATAQDVNSSETESTETDAATTADEPVDDHSGHDDHSGGHKDPVADVLLGILVILFLAKVVGDLFERVGMPAVLGELGIGILLGNWAFLMSGLWPDAALVFDFLKKENGDTGLVLDMLARIGVVLLLFEVGLESRVRDMMSVGVSSLLVALLGVVAPIVLGFSVGYLLLEDGGWQVPAFLGATLCATSVGITARVLKDLGRSQDRESKIILGAAVIDDVLGLVVLAVVTGVIQKGDQFEVSELVMIIVKSFVFLAGALLLGAMQFPRYLFKAAGFLRGHGLLVTTALTICFLFSYGANAVGLAPIIGAFAAGLILEGAHYQEVGEKWKHHELEEALAPLTALMVPIFFVATGLAVDLSNFSGGGVWMLAIGLTIAAVIGKQVCSLGVKEAGLNKIAVGVGMIPRGEVGLIFAQQGQGVDIDPATAGIQPLIAGDTYSAIIFMVMVTTMITPPLLKYVMAKPPGGASPDSAANSGGS